MTLNRLVRPTVLTVLLATALAAGQMAVLAGTPEAPPGPAGGPESISGSYVYLNNAITPSRCYTRGQTQTFCFQAISYTNDADYVYYLWQRFPDDWTVQDIYVQDTPYCTNGGTFGPFDWWMSAPNEVRIAQVRYHANPSDVCSAYYCFVVTSGSHSPGQSFALASWYWRSSEYGSPPFYPCSSDGYTPPGQPACDESTTSPAFIDPCVYRVYLPAVTSRWP